MSEAAKQKAQKLIDENAVMVFSKSYCPYCTATKTKLKGMGAKYNVLELDQIGKLNAGDKATHVLLRCVCY